jgi:hypothetical protein
MISWRIRVAVLAGFAAAGSAAFGGDYLLVPNFSSSTSGGNVRSIMLFNKSDGSLVNRNFIVGDANNVFTTPREAIQVGSDQIWICDQVANKVFRYNTSTNSFLPAITGNGTTLFNNLRGMEVVGNSVFVTNAGTGFGNTVVKIDVNTLNVTVPITLNQTNQNAPWDVQAVNGNLYVSNYGSGINGTTYSRIDKYDTNGSYLGNLYSRVNNSSPAGLLGPQQITVQPNGNLLVGGFINITGSVNSGVFEMNANTGALLNVNGSLSPSIAPGLGTRSGFRLGNGNVMFTKGDGVWVWDVNTNTYSPVAAGTNVNANFISEVSVPAPGALSVLCAGGMIARRRRR